MSAARCIASPIPTSAFAGFRFPPEVITLAVRWYLRFGLSYREVEELLAERSIEVDHVTIYRWVQRFTPLLIEAARPCRHVPGDRWFVDETYVKVAGRWVYLYRAIDQYGQVLDVLVSSKRDLAATRRFITRALEHSPRPAEVNTDRAPTYLRVLDELPPHGRSRSRPTESRLRPMRGLKRLRSTQVIGTGHAFIQNLRADTTNWPLTSTPTTHSQHPSPNSRSPFEQHTSHCRLCPPFANATAPDAAAWWLWEPNGGEEICLRTACS
jgi:IS6 family transposase